MTDVLFLGTGASIPSKNRTLPAVAIRHDSEVVLFDCGEGVQRQLMLSPLSFMKITAIFVTHLHGDHILGLPGLLQTMGMSGRRNPLLVAGPKGTTHSVRSLLGACDRSHKDRNPDPINDLEFPLEVVEMEHGQIIQMKGYSVKAFKTEHGVESIGFRFIENDLPGRFDKEKALSLGLDPGKDFSDIQKGITVKGISPSEIIGRPRPGCSIVYTGDTIPCDTLTEAVENATLLIHESTYSETDSKLATDNLHSTAKDAATLAKNTNVKMLALIHVSNRYDEPETLLEEAQAIFKNSIMPKDMDMLSITQKGIRSV